MEVAVRTSKHRQSLSLWTQERDDKDVNIQEKLDLCEQICDKTRVSWRFSIEQAGERRKRRLNMSTFRISIQQKSKIIFLKKTLQIQVDLHSNWVCSNKNQKLLQKSREITQSHKENAKQTRCSRFIVWCICHQFSQRCVRVMGSV